MRSGRWAYILANGDAAITLPQGIQFATSHFNLTAPDAGFLFASFGLVGVMSLMCMKRLCAIWNDVELILGGMVLMMACNLILIGPEKFPIWRLYLAIFFMYSLGYPIGHTAVMGMFSKVLGKRPQVRKICMMRVGKGLTGHAGPMSSRQRLALVKGLLMHPHLSLHLRVSCVLCIDVGLSDGDIRFSRFISPCDLPHRRWSHCRRSRQ